MILRLALPFLDTAARGGIVGNWHVREGQAIAFGDTLCDVVVDEWLSLNRPTRASTLVTVNDIAGQKATYEWRKGRAELTFHVVASESGYLRSVLTPTGTTVLVGDSLGIVTTELDEPFSVPGEGTPMIRAVATPAVSSEDE